MAVPHRAHLVAPPRAIDHVTLATGDHRAAKQFYERALRPLGFSIAFDWPEGGRAYLGVAGEPSTLWLVERDDARRGAVSLGAPDASAVDRFYAAALAAGARSLAPPAPRPEHTPSTYSAEVLDPDGNAVEAICWNAPPLAAEHAA